MGTPVPNHKIEQRATVSTEVKTYQLTPEELAKYGPVQPRGADNKFHARVCQAVKVSDNPEQAADLLGITVGKLKQYLGKSSIFPRWEKPETEDGTMLRSNSSRLDELREKLSKEQYLAFKESKLSDQVILKKLGYDSLSWLAPLTTLKKEWGVGGLRVCDPETMTVEEYAEKKPAAEAIGIFLSTLGGILALEQSFGVPSADQIAEELVTIHAAESVEIFLRQLGSALASNVLYNAEEWEEKFHQQAGEEDDDVISWATSRRPINRDATIRVHEKGASLNSHALREMVGITAVNVGVTKNGLLVVQRGSGPGAYLISRKGSPESKGSSAKIGGGSLGKFLREHGVKPGKYVLIRNEKKDRWEADVNNASQ